MCSFRQLALPEVAVRAYSLDTEQEAQLSQRGHATVHVIIDKRNASIRLVLY